MPDFSPSIRRFRMGLVLALGCAFGGCLGACNRDPAENGSSQINGTQQPTEPLLADWDSPQAVLVFTGDIHGHLEPCGCSEKQSGGMARRADLLRQLHEKGWPVTAFSVGGTLDEARVSYPQSKIKFATILDGLNKLDYQGLALGKEELMLGGQELFTQHTQVSAEDSFDVPFLAGNVVIFGSRDLGTPQESRVVTVGHVKVGVAAVAGNSTRQQLADTGAVRDENELLVQDPLEVLPGLIQKLQAQNPEVLVLLSASEMDESMELAKKFPEFDIVVTAGSAEDPRPEPVYVGETLLVQVGKKGKNAALVGIFPEQKLKLALIELDRFRFKNAPSMTELMQEYQDKLKEAWPMLSSQSIPDPTAGSYVGVDECKTCHTYAYGVWSKTRHAHAYESLIEGRKGQEENWVSRIYDPECLCCHTTGWDPQRALRHESGFIDMEKTPHLAGQQCENCHGPGSHHVQLEKNWKVGSDVSEELRDARQAMRVTLSEAKMNVCSKCHDLENSPDFDFDKYWPKVNHSGRKD